jgi:hypothetical protein
MAVEPCGASGGDLRRRARRDFDIEGQPIARQYASRNIVQMHQPAMPGALEMPHHFPWRILPRHPEPFPLEAQA